MQADAGSPTGGPGPHTPTVRVRGKGTVEAVPDAARISLGIATSKKSLKKAQDEAARIATAIIAAVKEAGIAARDIQTSRYSVYPRTDRDATGKETMLGYDVHNTVTIMVRDLDQLPRVLDAATGANANQIAGPDFFIQHPEGAEDEARRLAMASARRHAEVLAEVAGATLGRIRSIVEVETGGWDGGRVMYSRANVLREPVPIEFGIETITAHVEVVWELD